MALQFYNDAESSSIRMRSVMMNELMGWDFHFGFMHYGMFCRFFTARDSMKFLNLCSGQNW